MNKKLISINLILLVLFLLSNTSNAAGANAFTMTNGRGSYGQEVAITIKLNQQMEFANCDLTLEYDNSKIEYVRYNNLDIFKKSAMHIVENNSNNGKIAIGYVASPESTNQVINPGDMLSLTFKIKSNVSETTRLSLKCTSLKKDSGENTQVEDTYATITIVKGDLPSTGGSGQSSSTRTRTEQPTTINGINGNTQEEIPKTGTNENIIAISIVVLIMFNIFLLKKYLKYKDL